ncbi:HTH domain-containing protein, partial [Serratia marcescens]|uniref:HTH domain-containing protein n=1 Tax=Serratia marcescens TaxID=615 RepID=UPI001952AF3E
MMPVRQRRKKTAKEIAQHFGVCERTVRNHIAEERSTYEARADYRRNLAGTMREQGKSWAEIAAAIGGSEWSARALVRRYRTS